MGKRYLIILLVFCLAFFFASGVICAEEMDINEQIKAIEKKIQKAADVRAIKDLMAGGQRIAAASMGAGGPGMDSGLKTHIQCWGASDGWLFGNVGARMSERRAAGGQPGGVPTGFLDFHILTTAVIEVAEDGQTARALWYSPGMVATRWMYEMYAMEFVKEDGVWKSWHRTTHQDLSTELDRSWVDTQPDMREGDDREVDPNATPETKKDIERVVYEGWSPTNMPQYRPKPPLPYRTFGESLTYCPPIPQDLREELESKGMLY